MTHTLIEVRGLCHTYLAGTPLAQASLRGIDLTVDEGQVCCAYRGDRLWQVHALAAPQRAAAARSRDVCG